MKLSIVATLYKSEAELPEFIRRASAVAAAFADDSYELVFVNDGSPDSSLDIAIAHVERDPHIRVVDLSRNFGHHKAMMTGLMHASGELVFLLDSDLEEEPEWLPIFYKQMLTSKADVVFGQQSVRKGNLVERVTGNIFYSFFNWLTGLGLPRNIVTARLMTRRYVKALVLHDEREVFLAGLWHITGFKQVPAPVTKHCFSPTTYSIRARLSLLVNSVTAFSNLPLKGIFYCGVFILIGATFYSSYLIASKLSGGQAMTGWTSVIASIWMLGGLMISFIGICGIYLAKLFSETKRRPYTIIREIYEHKQ